ncbi:hypothetical protein I3W98_00715, partial [Streptomyces cavourensis]|nr:hypothetical protein [Streptomyces cavourensis]
MPATPTPADRPADQLRDRIAEAAACLGRSRLKAATMRLEIISPAS